MRTLSVQQRFLLPANPRRLGLVLHQSDVWDGLSFELVHQTISEMRPGALTTQRPFGPKRLAFTMVEVLVVVSIVLILISLAWVGYRASKVRAQVAVDISNLRQLGQAAAIYASQHNDVQPLSVRQLVADRLVGEGIVTSPLDPTTEGIATRFVSTLALPPDQLATLKHTVRTTYLGPGDGGWTQESYRMRMENRSQVGWLVNLALCDPGRIGNYRGTVGPYRRLLNDGSVRSKTMGYSSAFIDGIFESKVLPFADYFGEPNHREN